MGFVYGRIHQPLLARPEGASHWQPLFPFVFVVRGKKCCWNNNNRRGCCSLHIMHEEEERSCQGAMTYDRGCGGRLVLYRRSCGRCQRKTNPSSSPPTPVGSPIRYLQDRIITERPCTPSRVTQSSVLCQSDKKWERQELASAWLEREREK